MLHVSAHSIYRIGWQYRFSQAAVNEILRGQGGGGGAQESKPEEVRAA